MEPKSRRRWIEAGKILAEDPDASVMCPENLCAPLDVIDSPHPAGLAELERHMRCPKCGAYNAMLLTGELAERSLSRSDQ